jgi:Fe-S cluster assembly iron-binding protein IscA
MLQITAEASAHLRRVKEERGVDDAAGARFVNSSGRVGLTFVDAPHTGDQVMDASGVPVFVSPEIASTLDGTILDARSKEGQSVLVYRRRTDPPEPSVTSATTARSGDGSRS